MNGMTALNNARAIFEIVLPVIVFLLVLLFGYMLRRILFNRLYRWAKNTATELDDIIIAVTKGPFIIWCVMLGIYIALEVSKLPAGMVRAAGKILLVLGISSVMLVLANISTKLIKTYSGKIGTTFFLTSLTQNIIRIIIFGIGILIILNSLGVSIAPILAALGVGGLAVALALQDTLSNLFAGFHITLSKQIKVGDYIKLDSGDEGYVSDINWRTTKIRTISHSVVLIPNDKLSKAVIVNYHLPDKETAVTIPVGVHYASDLEKVEEVTAEVAREVIREVPAAVAGFPPVVRYQAFGDFSINLIVVLRVKEFAEQGAVKHEFIKRLYRRYKKEGIVIPYPVQAVNYAQEKAGEQYGKEENIDS